MAQNGGAQSAETLRLAAIVFTDIVGYSAVVHRDAGLGKRLLDRSRTIVRRQVTIHGGREIETAGDSFLLLFESTATALACVADIQRSLEQANRQASLVNPNEVSVQLRASIHLGDVEHRGSDIYGDGVNIAARILPHSPEGGVAFSDIVNRQIRNRLTVPSISIGTPTLKNIEQPIEIFTLDVQALGGIESAVVTARQTNNPAAVHPALYTTQTGKSGERAAPSLVWKFEHAEFNERALELTVAGEPVELERKPLEVLRHLLWHAGEVVTREELLDAVWPGRILSESVINKCISRLREALKDDDQRIIKTAHGYGYRLVAEVKIEHPKSTPLPAPRFNFNPGDSPPLRPQWKLKERIGVGGHGEAWLAEHEKTHEKRVYKFAFDDGALVALKREITLYRLLHDTLGDRDDFVRILDWNLAEAPFFTEAEHVEGGNLVQWAEGQGGLAALPLTTRIDLAAQIAETLAAAHAVGVLHKDLKPSNVVIASVQGSTKIKLMDFGSGGVINPQKLDEMGITRLGFTQALGNPDTTSGTPLYLPPEVLAGHPATVQGDIYALGVILYQLVVADLKKPLAPGWELEVEDELLREVIAEAAHGNPRLRTADASIVVSQLKTLESRRAERRAQQEEKVREQQTLRDAELAKHENERLKARRTGLLVAVAVLLVGLAASVWLYVQAKNARQTAQLRAADAEDMSNFLLEDVMGATSPDKKDTRELVAARALIESGAEKIDERFKNRLLTRVRVRTRFGAALMTLGDTAEAEKLYARAHQDARQGLDDGDPDALEAGLVIISGNAAETGTAYLDRLMALADRRLAVDDPRRFDLHERHALNLLLNQGEDQRALAELKSLEATLRSTSGEHLEHTSEILLALGDAYFTVGDMDASLRSERDALPVAVQWQGVNGGWPVNLHIAIGKTLAEQGHYGEAAKELEEALRGARATRVESSVNVIRARMALAELSALQGESKEGDDVMNTETPLFMAHANSVDEGAWLEFPEMAAWIRALILEQYPAAEADLHTVIDARVGFKQSDTPEQFSNLVILSVVLAQTGRADQARATLAALPADQVAIALRRPPDRINLRRAQGLTALALANKTEAMDRLKDALETSQKVWGADSFWTHQLEADLRRAQQM